MQNMQELILPISSQELVLSEDYTISLQRFIEPLRDKNGELSEENKEAARTFSYSLLLRDLQRVKEQTSEQLANMLLEQIVAMKFYEDKSRTSAAMYHLRVGKARRTRRTSRNACSPFLHKYHTNTGRNEMTKKLKTYIRRNPFHQGFWGNQKRFGSEVKKRQCTGITDVPTETSNGESRA